MSLFKRSHREERQWLPEPIVPPFPGVDPLTGGISGPSGLAAMRLSAVWACVRLISSSVSMMPMSAYVYNSDGSRSPVPNPPLLSRPVDISTPLSSFVYQTMVSLLLKGNAYLQITSADSLGRPTQVRPLNPDRVRVDQDRDTGQLKYTLGNQTLTAARMWHLRAFPFPGMDVGLSPIQNAAQVLSTVDLAAKFGRDFFADGAHPTALLSTNQNLNQEQAASTKSRFMASQNGREPAILSGGMTYQAIQVSPDESQFLNTQKYGVAEICRIFGVPPEMVASDVSNSMTYANVEQRSIDFLTYCVQPWLTLLEDAFALVLPGSQHVRFDTSVLTRTDYETLIKSNSIAIASKQMTPNEARAMRDLDPLTPQQLLQLGAQSGLTVGPTGAPKPIPPSPEDVPDPSSEVAND